MGKVMVTVASELIESAIKEGGTLPSAVCITGVPADARLVEAFVDAGGLCLLFRCASVESQHIEVMRPLFRKESK